MFAVNMRRVMALRDRGGGGVCGARTHLVRGDGAQALEDGRDVVFAGVCHVHGCEKQADSREESLRLLASLSNCALPAAVTSRAW